MSSEVGMVGCRNTCPLGEHPGNFMLSLIVRIVPVSISETPPVSRDPCFPPNRRGRPRSRYDRLFFDQAMNLQVLNNCVKKSLRHGILSLGRTRATRHKPSIRTSRYQHVTVCYRSRGHRLGSTRISQKVLRAATQT